MFWNDDKDGIEVMPDPGPVEFLAPRFFHEGNPQTGKDATPVRAHFLNTIKRELLNVVYAGGLIPDKFNNAQLLWVLMKWGIWSWDKEFNYEKLPWLVWGSDNMIYVAIKPSGPGLADVGPKDPTTTTGYWVTFPRWLGILPVPTAAQTFYIRNNGNDLNNGRSDDAEGAFRTLSGAITYVLSTQSTSPYPITFNITTDGDFSLNNQPASIPSGVLSTAYVDVLGTGVNCAFIINAPLGVAFYSSGGHLRIHNVRVAYTPTSQAVGAWGSIFGVSGGSLTIGTLWLSSTVGANITQGISGLVVLNNGACNTGTAFGGGTNLTFNAKTIIVGTMYLTGGGFWLCGNPGYPTIINVGGVTGGAPFIYMADSSRFQKYSGTLTFSGAQTGIGARYTLLNYSRASTNGGGVNMFPGTVAGTAPASLYCIYE